MNLGVCADEFGCHAFAFGARPGGADHRLRNVDADATRLRSQPSCRGDRRAARAAPDVQYPASRHGSNLFDEEVFERLEDAVEEILRVDPGSTRDAVPPRRLLVVTRARDIHDCHRLLMMGSDPLSESMSRGL